ncbi:MAG: alkaline phosphatase [Saprospiraceae bacterium]|nr:alkaline phosphatase [Candidatus Vicinibacter affinis]
MIGDGMGLTQISAGLYENGNHLSLEGFSIIGLHKSYSADSLITDSAAGATAFSIGLKTKNGFLGVDSSGNTHLTILEESILRHFSTGLITTTSIVHATPAAFVSHQPDREKYESIAKDMMDVDFNLIIGGGKKYFERRKTDSFNLINLLIAKGYMVKDYFEEDYATYKIPPINKFCFFTADGDPLPAMRGRDYLSKATKDGIRFLKNQGSKGFFLMVEGGQIDWGGHDNVSEYIVTTEVLDFDKAVNEALEFARRDKSTLVIVTGDHETGGYSILPGSEMGKLKTAFTTKKHTADLIPVFAIGPGAEQFAGIYENTEIYHKMRRLLFRNN